MLIFGGRRKLCVDFMMGKEILGATGSDYSVKILMVGDSGVGKSSILLSFISNVDHDLSPTIGMSFSP